MVRFNTSGGVVWNTTWGHSTDDRSQGITSSSSGNNEYIYVTGYEYQSPPNFQEITVVKYTVELEQQGGAPIPGFPIGILLLSMAMLGLLYSIRKRVEFLV